MSCNCLVIVLLLCIVFFCSCLAVTLHAGIVGCIVLSSSCHSLVLTLLSCHCLALNFHCPSVLPEGWCCLMLFWQELMSISNFDNQLNKSSNRMLKVCLVIHESLPNLQKDLPWVTVDFISPTVCDGPVFIDLIFFCFNTLDHKISTCAWLCEWYLVAADTDLDRLFLMSDSWIIWPESNLDFSSHTPMIGWILRLLREPNFDARA